MYIGKNGTGRNCSMFIKPEQKKIDFKNLSKQFLLLKYYNHFKCIKL